MLLFFLSSFFYFILFRISTPPHTHHLPSLYLSLSLRLIEFSLSTRTVRPTTSCRTGGRKQNADATQHQRRPRHTKLVLVFLTIFLSYFRMSERKHYRNEKKKMKKKRKSVLNFKKRKVNLSRRGGLRMK